MKEALIHLIVFLPVILVYNWIIIQTYKFALRRRETKFFKHVSLEFPEAHHISFSSCETSDAEALRIIKEQLDGLR